MVLTWCVPDAKYAYDYAELHRIVEAINEITQKKINTTIELELIPLGDYTEAMNMKYIFAERWDICFSGLWNDYTTAVSHGNAMDLSMAMLQTYAPDLLDRINPVSLEALKINGKLYGLPIQHLQAQQGGLFFDTRLAEELGFDWRNVQKLEDLEPYFDLLLANGYQECIILNPWDMRDCLQSYFGFDYPLSYEFPAAVRVSDKNCTVINPYDTKEFKEFAQLIYRWYNKGYFTSDAFNGSQNNDNGRFPVVLRTVTASGEQWDYGFEGKVVPLGQAVLTTANVQSMTLIISSYCLHPERAVAFINLLSSDAELLNLIVYGQEGVDWNWVDQKEKLIQIEEYAYPGVLPYLAGNDYLDYYTDRKLVGTNETVMEINADARASVLLGFKYNADNMSAEIVNVQVASHVQIQKILCGMAGDPDAAIAKLNADLYAAGLQEVLDDMQSQVDTWKASR